MSDQEKFEYYITCIGNALTVMFRDDEERELYEAPNLDLGEIDATLFFTAIPYAVGIIYRAVVQDRKNHLEVTHLMNALVHQWETKRAVAEALEGKE